MRILLLTMLSLTLLSCGCVARNNYGTGYGGYGGYGQVPQSGAYIGYPGTTYQPPQATTYNPYSQPVFAPYGQTIAPPATGTLGPGQGYYQQPGQSYAPAYSPPTGASSSGTWQPVAPTNSGVQNSRAPRPAVMPRNLRLATNLAWGTSSGSVSPANYNSPTMSTLPSYTSPVAATDCGCDGPSTANATYLAPIPR